MKYYHYFIYLLTVFSVTACQKAPSLADRIDQSIDQRIEAYKKKKINDCKNEIAGLAEIYVDSIMYLEIGTSLQGTFSLPERPFRPGDSTGYKIKLDSAEVSVFELDSVPE